MIITSNGEDVSYVVADFKESRCIVSYKCNGNKIYFEVIESKDGLIYSEEDNNNNNIEKRVSNISGINILNKAIKVIDSIATNNGKLSLFECIKLNSSLKGEFYQLNGSPVYSNSKNILLSHQNLFCGWVDKNM